MSVSSSVDSALRHLRRRPALIESLVSHVEPDATQVILWSPVLFASGIGAYFLMPGEPELLPVTALCVVTLIGALMPRRYPSVATICKVLTLFAAGVLCATLRTEFLDTKILVAETAPIELSATLRDLERRPDGTVRLTLEEVIAQRSKTDLPDRVRITVRTEIEPLAVGDQIRTRAVLMPPGSPVIPGGFDFGRQAWFDGLGAVGYNVAAIERINSGPAAGASLDSFVTRLRIGISQRIQSHLEEPSAGIAIALMTGRREAISEETYSVFRDSGIAHILALSGLHMGLVAGLLFFSVRALLAMWEKGALYFPIKKWAAGATLLGCFFYLFVGGMSVSIQRAFIMTGLILLAVMLDRTAISMHRVAWAAMAVLVLAPESLMEAGFQMSFAAVVALIAFYERYGNSLLTRLQSKPLVKRIGFYLLGILATTLVSDLATAPFAAYHFNRVAGLSLITNLFAVPLVGAWIMPCALAAYFLMPLGAEAVALIPMGWGIDLLFAGAGYIASRPDSVFLIPSIPTTAFLLFVFGGLWLCLWRAGWRKLGLLPMCFAVFLMLTANRPDILVAPKGNLAAVRLSDGSLSISTHRGGRYVREKWLQGEGIAEAALWSDPDSQAKGALHCDQISCLMRAKGFRVVFAKEARALAEDCLKADLLIATFPVPEGCGAPSAVIDLWDLRAGGTHAIYVNERFFEIVTTAATRGHRPWTIRE